MEVRVLDINDNAPMFSQLVYNVTVGEDASNGTAVIVVSATDGDAGQNAAIRYSLRGITDNRPFNINSMTGVIR